MRSKATVRDIHDRDVASTPELPGVHLVGRRQQVLEDGGLLGRSTLSPNHRTLPAEPSPAPAVNGASLRAHWMLESRVSVQMAYLLHVVAQCW